MAGAHIGMRDCDMGHNEWLICDRNLTDLYFSSISVSCNCGHKLYIAFVNNCLSLKDLASISYSLIIAKYF